MNDDGVAVPLHLTQDEAIGDRFLIYQTEQGAHLELQYEGNTFWMTQEQMASLFGIDPARRPTPASRTPSAQKRGNSVAP